MKKLVQLATGLILILTAVVTDANPANEDAPVSKWNLVFILADDMGWNQAGYHGSDFYETPNIDRIANAGMQFTAAYSANPVCSPTRLSLMSGKNPARLHLTDYIPGSPFPYARLTQPKVAPGLPLAEKTLAELMKENGYVTGHFGKWHLNKDKNYVAGRPKDPASQGFDEVLTTVKPKGDADPAADAHHAVQINNRALKFIDEYRDEPFFLYVSHHVVHRPLMENPALVAKYEAKAGADDPVNNPIMAAMFETMDNGIGQILDRLDKYGLTDRTIVIFYSDNGGLESLNSQAPFRGGKATIWEGGIRVPLAIKWPGVVKAGTRSDVPVISDDFFPTFADILNTTDVPAELDGESLVPLLRQTGSLHRDALYFHYPHYHHLGYKPGGAIRMGDYKLIEWFEPSLTGAEHALNLFNLKQDPGETTDLSADKPELVQQMLAQMKAWRQSIGAEEMHINPDYDPDRADWRFETQQ